MNRLFRSLLPHEIFMLLFALFLSLIAIAGMSVFPDWPQVVIRMALVSTGILFVTWMSSGQERTESLLRFYVIPVVPVYFKTVEFLTQPISSIHNDQILVAADRLICFGANPTQWLFQHFPTWPLLTEYLQLCYSTFYFLPVAVAIELFVRARKTLPDNSLSHEESDSWKSVDDMFFIVIYGFLLSYLTYLILPSIGPRFTVHDFFSIDRDLPGLALTGPIRDLLNKGENILPGMTITQILGVVSRDAFPSGHTDVTLLTIIMAFRFRTRSRWWIAIIGASLIFSTVYLRYHYVIDVIGGSVLAVITLYSWEYVRSVSISLRDKLARA
jgi:membrane-associated phospholipid phosphatase